MGDTNGEKREIQGKEENKKAKGIEHESKKESRV